MTKADLIEQITKVNGYSKKYAAELVEQVFEVIKDTLGQGEDLKLSGFGNFTVRKKADRRGRNPQTGENITITARRVLSFKPSAVLRAELNRLDLSGLLDSSGSIEDVAVKMSGR